MALNTTLNFYGGYNRQATYWSLAAVDGFGKRSFNAPVLINVSWTERTDLSIKSQGELVSSKAVVYVQAALKLGEYLALGDQTGITDPETIPETAFMICETHADTSLLGFESFYSVVL